MSGGAPAPDPQPRAPRPRPRARPRQAGGGRENAPQITLDYPGKVPREEVYGITKPAEFRVVGEYGAPAPADGWRNMLILGDSLAALRALLGMGEVRGKVRLVYTDPPFGTGNTFRGRRHTSRGAGDGVAYQDFSFGPGYLEFLRRALILLHDMLAEDGSIYVHMSVRSAHYVKVLMDEVFGMGNMLNDIARVKCAAKSFRRRAYGNIRDSVLFYAKNRGRNVWNDPREPYTEDGATRLFAKVDKDGRRYMTEPLHAPGETKAGPTGAPWRGVRPPPGKHWQYPPEVLDELDREGRIEWSRAGNPRLKIYADERLKNGRRMQDVWANYKDPAYPSYPTEKNLEMVMKIVEASSNPGDIVLDAFCGSGTTAVAAERLNRRWICIDVSPVAVRTALRRILNIENHATFNVIDATSG